MPEQEPEQKERVLVCAPADWECVAGSSIINGDCGHRVWVAPSGRAALRKHKMAVRCVPCTPEVWSEGVKRVINPGSLEEIEDALGVQKRAAMERIFKAMGVQTDD